MPADPETAVGQQPFADRAARRSTQPFPWGSALAVAAGGAIGGSARYGVELLTPTYADRFPWATFSVNIIGALLLAALLVLVLEVWSPTRYVRPFLAVGLLGSFTTFSTFMVEFDQLLSAHAYLTAGLYLAGTLVLGLAATAVGLFAVRGLIRRHPREEVR